MGNVLVLWDLDFTLLYAGGMGADVYREVFRELFRRDLDWVPPMAGRTERAIIVDTLTAEGIGDSPRQVDAFVAALSARAPALREAFVKRGHALPGATTALAAIAAVSATEPSVLVQSVLTGNIRAIAEAKITAFGLGDHLDLAVGAYGEYHEVRAELVHLARRLATRAYGCDFGGAATVLLGDTPLDVEAGLAAGARVIGVASGASSVADLTAAGASAVLPDLTDSAALVAAVLGQAAPAQPPTQASFPGVAGD